RKAEGRPAPGVASGSELRLSPLSPTLEAATRVRREALAFLRAGRWFAIAAAHGPPAGAAWERRQLATRASLLAARLFLGLRLLHRVPDQVERREQRDLVDHQHEEQRPAQKISPSRLG